MQKIIVYNNVREGIKILEGKGSYTSNNLGNGSYYEIGNIKI